MGPPGTRLAQDAADQRDLPDYLFQRRAEPPSQRLPTPAAPPSPTPPDDRLRLPERATRDLGFLEGCWVTDPFQYTPSHVPAVSTYCFDVQGKGSLSHQSGNRHCRLPATAQFSGNRLRFVDTDGTCSDGASWHADHLDCERGANGVARCSGRARSDAGSADDRWTVNLHRRK